MSRKLWEGRASGAGRVETDAAAAGAVSVAPWPNGPLRSLSTSGSLTPLTHSHWVETFMRALSVTACRQKIMMLSEQADTEGASCSERVSCLNVTE